MTEKQDVKQTKNAMQTYKTGLIKAQELYVDMAIKNAEKMALTFSSYQVNCIRNTISAMQELLWKEGLEITKIEQNNVSAILTQVALLQINLAATPREGYLILRNQKIKTKDGREDTQKIFEFGLEGDGNDKLLRTYGVDIKKVHNHWVVREGDDFTYPTFSGLDITPPTWAPKSYTGKVIRVVYPIEKLDGTVEYHIAERESVVANLQAHISNNLMWEKDPKKLAIKDRIAGMTLDEIFADSEAMAIASPAWRSAHSREAMILRKLRNNVTKKYPKDYTNSFVERAYEDTFEDYDQYSTHPDVDPEKVVEAEFDEQAGTEEIEVIEETSQDDEVLSEVEKERVVAVKAKKKVPF